MTPVEEKGMSFAVGAVVDDKVDMHGTEYKKDDIDSLIRQLREKDALIAAKDALLSQQANKPHPLKQSVKFAPNAEDAEVSRAVDDEPATYGRGLEQELAGSVRTGSNATFADYLNAQKSMRFKSQQSQKWQRNSLAVIGEGNDALHASTASVRTAEERRVIRRILSRRGAAAEWVDINVDELDEDEPEDHHHKKNDAWYLPPVQRQRWCDDQILPHVNWGDLFFDLFYVGAAYNLGVLIKSCTKDSDAGKEILRGLLYFFGSLGPLWTCWEAHAFYASRYLTNDYFHRLVEIIRYFCVGAAIYNIAPISHFSDPKKNDVMIFTLTMLVELIMSMGLGVELYCKGQGDRLSIKNHTLDDFKFRNGALFALYLAAFILATVQHNGYDETKQGTENYGAEHRVLGPSSYEDQEAYSPDRPKWDKYDLPMTITASAYFFRFVLASVRFHYREKKSDVRNWYVPANIDYLIHRYGEFVMLMMGEGVLSVLIVETVDEMEYDMVLLCGMLSMIFLNMLKTESDPADASKHALWRSPVSVMTYSLFTQTLTIGLIGFGVTFKTFLYRIVKESVGNEDLEYDFASKTFSGFLTGVILSLELINASHRGFKKSFGDLFRDNEGKQKLNLHVAIIALLKIGIILFCVTLFTWTDEPQVLVVSGLLIIVALIVTRVLDHLFVHETELVQKTH